MTTREDIAFLVGSTSRIEILERLQHGPSTPTALAEQCSCARETAQRTLSGFVARNWVEKVNGQYHLSGGGSAVLDQYDQLRQVVRGAERFSEFYTNAGDAFQDFPIHVHDDITVTKATTENPHAPIGRFLTFIGTEEVTSFRGLAPIVSRVFNEAVANVIGPDTEIELVIDESVLSTSEREFPDALQRAYDLEQFTLCLSPDDVEYGLTLVDGRVFLGAYDEKGNLVASADGDSEALRDWATARYDEYRRAATEVESGIQQT